MRIDVAFTPAEAGPAHVAVVVDVMRATSTIAQALASGYRRVLCCREIADARALRRQLGDEAVVGGERDAVQIEGFDLGASPRAIICWGRLAKVWALLQRQRTEVYPEDIQELAPYVLSHRVWLGPHAASHGLTSEAVIQDIIDHVPIP